MRLLTEEQKMLLKNKEFVRDNVFNPIQDANDNWVISDEEVNLCENEAFLWVKDLPQIEYKTKNIDPFWFSQETLKMEM